MARPVHCPLCHAVDVRPDAEVLDLAAATMFRCRACRRLALVPTGPPGHPEAPPPGPPLGPDDLIELHALLDGDGWWTAHRPCPISCNSFGAPAQRPVGCGAAQR